MVSPGALQSSEPERYTPFAGERVTVSELLALDGERRLEPAFLRRALASPLHYKMRHEYEEQLATLL